MLQRCPTPSPLRGIRCNWRPRRGRLTLHLRCLSIQSQASSCVLGSCFRKRLKDFILFQAPFSPDNDFLNPFECGRMGFTRTRSSGLLSAVIKCFPLCNQSNQTSTILNQAYLDSNCMSRTASTGSGQSLLFF